MRLFHASEEPDITVFHPRLPSRRDLDPTVGLVWAIDEEHLPNFLTPRDCPRVTFHIRPETTEDDRRRFFSSDTVRHAVIIEHDWFDRMRNTTLYLYEFDPTGFVMQDEVAGYYVSVTAQTLIARHVITDLPGALIARGVELRITDNLRRIAEDVKSSSLGWSLCRMANAKP
ncbi:MAG: hypothetical protein E7604_07095 [Ruminococcaceae bacterium]|nr:hypothetical protein [Oscillospiraceae bacterium]